MTTLGASLGGAEDACALAVRAAQNTPSTPTIATARTRPTRER
jgi:hypothetical protein